MGYEAQYPDMVTGLQLSLTDDTLLPGTVCKCGSRIILPCLICLQLTEPWSYFDAAAVSFASQHKSSLGPNKGKKTKKNLKFLGKEGTDICLVNVAFQKHLVLEVMTVSWGVLARS
jgi:hypothetical protein